MLPMKILVTCRPTSSCQVDPTELCKVGLRHETQQLIECCDWLVLGFTSVQPNLRNYATTQLKSLVRLGWVNRLGQMAVFSKLLYNIL